jgi:SulP family sulfate permease
LLLLCGTSAHANVFNGVGNWERDPSYNDVDKSLIQTVIAVDWAGGASNASQPKLSQTRTAGKVIAYQFSRKDVPADSAINSKGSDAHGSAAVIGVFLAIPFILGFCIHWSKRDMGQALSLFGMSGDEFQEGELNPTTMFSRQSSMDTEEPHGGTLITNLLTGVVAGLGCLPEAISFSFIVGINPLNGIWAGIFLSLSSSLVGGRPGLVSCASAATSVLLIDINRDLGMGAMSFAVLICSALQFLFGLAKLDRLVILIPHPVMIGFCNGLAIVIFLAQLGHFDLHELSESGAAVGRILVGLILTVLVSMLTAVTWPRLPKVGQWLPAPFAAIMVAVGFSYATSSIFPQRTLEDVSGKETFQGGLASIPPMNFPPAGVDWSDARLWSTAFAVGARMAFVGLTESLLTVKLLDRVMGPPKGSTRMECFGQALGNLLAGLFGTQGGCALIGQSLINVGSGGHRRISSIVSGVTLLFGVTVLAPALGKIPVAALVGLMFLVSLNTFVWASLSTTWDSLRQKEVVGWVDVLVVALVTIVTVITNLATAVLLGLFVSGMAFAWDIAHEVKIQIEPSKVDDDTSIVKLEGPLFFASAMNFQGKVRVDAIPQGKVVIDLSRGRVLDHSGLDTILTTEAALKAAGKGVVYIGLSESATRYMAAMREDTPESCAKGDHMIKIESVK